MATFSARTDPLNSFMQKFKNGIGYTNNENEVVKQKENIDRTKKAFSHGERSAARKRSTAIILPSVYLIIFYKI